MKLYHYARRTNVFTGESDAKLDPEETRATEKNVYLIPKNATTIKPPTAGKKEVAIFDDGEWVISKNLIGTVYHFTDRDGSFTMEGLGELPVGAVIGEKPVGTVDLWLAVRAERNNLLNQSDWLVLPDSPVTGPDLDNAKRYRKELRDIPQVFSDPKNITWPRL